MRTLRTARLRLTPVTPQNANVLWRVLQQPDLRTYQDLPTVGAPTFTAMVAKRPKTLSPGATGRFEWLLYLHGGRRALGWVSLRIADRDPRSGEIGYSLVRDYRGRGLATEAVRVLIEEAFEYANLDRVHAYCMQSNEGSRRVLARLGFRRDGVLPHGASVGGRPVDVLAHALDRATFDQSKNSTVIPAFA